jgi:hypothetical protein
MAEHDRRGVRRFSAASHVQPNAIDQVCDLDAGTQIIHLIVAAGL